MSLSVHRPRFRRVQSAARPVLLLLGLGLLIGCDPDEPVVCNGGSGRDADNCLAFRRSDAPTIDGFLTEEAWVPSFRYVLGDGNGTSVPHAIAQGMRTSDALYLSFEVNNDPLFDLDDAIVLAFDPDGSATNHRRIHIYPVFPAGGDGVPNRIHYWKDSTLASWSDPDSAPPAPAWLAGNILAKHDDSGTSKHWRVEIKIPIVAGPGDPGINLPSTDDFGFYFSVIVVETNPPVTGVVNPVAEESWPLGVNVGAFIENTPPASSWGNGIFGRNSNGVTIGFSDITTDQLPNPLHIEIDEPNTFRANVHNGMVNTAGAGVIARNVQVSFRLKNFGIPAATPWDLVPTGNNPTPPHDIPAGAGTPPDGTFLFQTSPWTVPPSPSPLREQYLDNPNQCLRVELETTGPDTLIVNRRGFSNMTFVDTSSPFEQSAVVGTDGYRPPDGQRELEFLLREFRYNTQAQAPWMTELTGAQQVAERLYRLRTPGGPDAPIKTRITPPNIQIPVERIEVKPGRTATAKRIAVRPGNLITLVAQGSIKRGDATIRPNGIDPTVGDAQAPRTVASGLGKDKRFPLGPHDSPERRIGALVGSFDGFARSAFVVGRATTIMVPEGVDSLTLGTNDTAEGWQQQSGPGYQVEVIQTPPDDIYRHTSSLLPRKAPRQVLTLPLGQNLPTWMLCGQHRTGRTLTINRTAYQRYQNTGCFAYAVKSIGRTVKVPGGAPGK